MLQYMSSDTDYFLIENGTAKKLFSKYLADCTVINKRRIAFIKAIKAKTLYEYDNGGICSAVFDKDPDLSMWKPAKRAAGWVPRRTTPEGKALYKEMFALEMPDFPAVAASIIGTGRFLWGMRMYYAGFEYLGKEPVIMLPHPFGDKAPPKPVNKKNHWAMGYEISLVDGVTKLRASHYWWMKEEIGNKIVDREKIPRLRTKSKATSAFTFIEICICLSILAILAAFTIPLLVDSKKVRDAKIQAAKEEVPVRIHVETVKTDDPDTWHTYRIVTDVQTGQRWLLLQNGNDRFVQPMEKAPAIGPENP